MCLKYSIYLFIYVGHHCLIIIVLHSTCLCCMSMTIRPSEYISKLLYYEKTIIVPALSFNTFYLTVIIFF